MKITTISQTNAKGQVVIPKSVRDLLGITPQTLLNIVLRGEGVYLYPIKEFLTYEKETFPYLEILKRTQGAWGKDLKEEKLERKRKRLELMATKRNKKEW